MSLEESVWKVCSTCRKPIEFEKPYYACSVSTCNRKRTGLFFCSVECFDAHVPEARHRDAWAEQNRAPTREQWEREQAEAAAAETVQTAAEQPANPEVRRRIVSKETEEELPRDVLVVVSKLKAYVRARSGMNTSDGVVGVLSDHLRRLCDEAIRSAARDGRKTVMERDFHSPP
jgi:histone H3/H4